MLGLLGALAIAVLPLLGSLARRAIERRRCRTRCGGQADRGDGAAACAECARFTTAPARPAFSRLTVVIWCLDALGAVIGGAALGLRDSDLAVAFLLIAGLGVGSALPSTPGYVGIYQFVAVTVLTPFGFSRTDAIAYILVAQALMLRRDRILGIVWILASAPPALRLKRPSRRSDDDQHRPLRRARGSAATPTAS